MRIPPLPALALLAGLAAGPALAQNASTASANSSAALSMATASLVAGSAATLATASQLTVAAMEVVGESVVMVLKDVSKGVEVSVQASAKVAGNASLAVGSVITVTASAAGWSLYQAGRLIAFIPNEVGRSLIHHEKTAR